MTIIELRSLKINDVVRAREDFHALSQPVIKIPQGKLGLVKHIDVEDNECHVQFDGIDHRIRIPSSSLFYIEKTYDTIGSAHTPTDRESIEKLQGEVLKLKEEIEHIKHSIESLWYR